MLEDKIADIKINVFDLLTIEYMSWRACDQMVMSGSWILVTINFWCFTTCSRSERARLWSMESAKQMLNCFQYVQDHYTYQELLSTHCRKSPRAWTPIAHNSGSGGSRRVTALVLSDLFISQTHDGMEGAYGLLYLSGGGWVTIGEIALGLG